MKAPPFDYVSPAGLEEAGAALGAREDAVALAGGQSILAALNLRERRAGLLVDLRRVAALRGIRDGEVLRVGAMEPMWDLERHPAVRTGAPLLTRALATVGAPAIRSRATLGGSAAWADPSSQVPATLAALDAVLETTRRRVPAAELAVGPRRTRLERGELLVTVRLPRADGAGFGLRHVRRSSITWPVAGCATVVRMRDGVVGSARIVLYGAGGGPVVAAEAAASLEQRAPEPAALEAAASAAAAVATPYDDARASAAYRAAVLPVLVRRALHDAIAAP